MDSESMTLNASRKYVFFLNNINLYCLDEKIIFTFMRLLELFSIASVGGYWLMICTRFFRNNSVFACKIQPYFDYRTGGADARFARSVFLRLFFRQRSPALSLPLTNLILNCCCSINSVLSSTLSSGSSKTAVVSYKLVDFSLSSYNSNLLGIWYLEALN